MTRRYIINSCSRNPLAFLKTGFCAGGMSVLRGVDKGGVFPFFFFRSRCRLRR